MTQEDPKGYLITRNFSALFNAGCIQTGADLFDEPPGEDWHNRFYILATITNNNPCNGCPVYNGGKCTAFQRYHTAALEKKQAQEQRIKESTAPQGTKKYPNMSVSQIADKLNVSKKQVRRMKTNGEI